MKIELRRIPKPYSLHPTPSINGSLYISGQYLCDTEEHPRTALPAGEYRVVRHYCKQYDRFMPVILTVTSDEPRALSSEEHTGKPMAHGSKLTTRCESCEKLELVFNNTNMPRQCPMLKPGNGVHHRADGSIILGTRVIPGCLKHPLQAFEPLAERVRKAISRGHTVTLIIKDLQL